MKPYEKPKLIALSLAGNERLCGDCFDNRASYLLSKSPTGMISWYLDTIGGNGDGEMTKPEAKNMFNTADACDKPVKVDSYCKFTGTIMVAWS